MTPLRTSVSGSKGKIFLRLPPVLTALTLKIGVVTGSPEMVIWRALILVCSAVLVSEKMVTKAAFTSGVEEPVSLSNSVSPTSWLRRSRRKVSIFMRPDLAGCSVILSSFPCYPNFLIL